MEKGLCIMAEQGAAERAPLGTGEGEMICSNKLGRLILNLRTLPSSPNPHGQTQWNFSERGIQIIPTLHFRLSIKIQGLNT